MTRTGRLLSVLARAIITRDPARPGPGDSDTSESVISGDHIPHQRVSDQSVLHSRTHHTVDAKASGAWVVPNSRRGLRRQPGRRSPETAEGDPTGARASTRSVYSKNHICLVIYLYLTIYFCLYSFSYLPYHIFLVIYLFILHVIYPLNVK